MEGRETVADESGHINSVLVVAEQEDRKTEDGGHSDDLLVGDKLGAETGVSISSKNGVFCKAHI